MSLLIYMVIMLGILMMVCHLMKMQEKLELARENRISAIVATPCNWCSY